MSSCFAPSLRVSCGLQNENENTIVDNSLHASRSFLLQKRMSHTSREQMEKDTQKKNGFSRLLLRCALIDKRIFLGCHSLLTTQDSFLITSYYSSFTYHNITKQSPTDNPKMNPTSVAILVLAAVASTTTAFHVHPVNNVRTVGLQAAKDGRATQPTVVDIDRAKFCEEHFGECSVEEIEQLRNGRFYQKHVVSCCLHGALMTKNSYLFLPDSSLALCRCRRFRQKHCIENVSKI